jgi:hypothetical protein
MQKNALLGVALLLQATMVWAQWSMPDRVDHLAAIGVRPQGPGAGGLIKDLKGKRVSVLLGANLVNGVDFSKKVQDSGHKNPLTHYFIGGKEQINAISDPNPQILSFAAMLKTHFPDVQLVDKLADAAGFDAVVVADIFLDQKGPGFGSTVSVTWDGRLDFIAPTDSRVIHRSIVVSHSKGCPAPSWGDGAKGLHSCRNNARDEMLAELRNRLDAAMRAE